MRLWLENMLSDCADVVLAFGDWLYETLDPPLAALEEKMHATCVMSFTRTFILLILIVMAVIG